MQTPRQLVSAAFNAMRARDYDELASMCDPLSLKSFRQEFLDEYCPIISDVVDHSPHPEIELTDEQYIELMELLDPIKRLKEEFGPATTIDGLVAMEPVRLFAAWLYAHSAERFSGKRLQRPWQSETDRTSEDFDQNGTTEPRHEIIGCVFDTPEIAHVVYRLRLSAIEAIPDAYRGWFDSAAPAYRDFMTAMHHRGDPSLVTCRRQGDGSWRLIAKKHFMGFGAISISAVSSDDEDDF